MKITIFQSYDDFLTITKILFKRQADKIVLFYFKVQMKIMIIQLCLEKFQGMVIDFTA